MNKAYPETGWQHLVFPALYGIASLRVLASPSCLFHPHQLLPLPALPSTLLNKRFPNLSPLTSMFSLAGSICARLRRSLPQACLHPGLLQRNPCTPFALSPPKGRFAPGLGWRQGGRIKTPLFLGLPPAPAAAGFGLSAWDHGSISPPTKQTTLLSKLVVLPFLSPRQSPFTHVYK